MNYKYLQARLDALKDQIPLTTYCEVGQYLAEDELEQAEAEISFLEDNISEDYNAIMEVMADYKEGMAIDNYEQEKA